jgi:hypothetical protein
MAPISKDLWLRQLELLAKKKPRGLGGAVVHEGRRASSRVVNCGQNREDESTDAEHRGGRLSYCDCVVSKLEEGLKEADRAMGPCSSINPRSSILGPSQHTAKSNTVGGALAGF